MSNPPNPMMMIRYKVKPDQVDRHLELLRAVYEELESARPDGLRWATFQLADGISFIDLAAGGGQGRLSRLEAFQRFRATLDERCDEPPVMTELRAVGSFRFD